MRLAVPWGGEITLARVCPTDAVPKASFPEQDEKGAGGGYAFMWGEAVVTGWGHI